MNLAWHIAKKDLRRLALPVGAWLAVLLVSAIAFRAISPSAQGHAASAIDMWRNVAFIWVRLLEGLQIFTACLLAGYLVLGDPLTDTNTFWMTRPISRGRLLAAKLMAAVVLFLAAPVVVLMPVWVASGFGAGDIVVAAGQFATSYGGWVLLALMAGSLARSLPQFLFFSLVIVVAFFSSSLIAAYLWRDESTPVRASREWQVMVGVLPVMALVLTHQFLTRRSVRTWLLIGGALAALVIIRSAWLWELPSGDAAQRLDPPRESDHPADVVAAKSFTQHQINSLPSLYGTTVWRRDVSFVPMVARTPNGEVAMRAGGVWAAQASLHALGFTSATDPLRWQLVNWLRRPGTVMNGTAHLGGTLEVWAVRWRVLGEMPVQVGAELSVGGNRTRILTLQFNDGRLDRIYLEELDTLACSREMWEENWSVRPRGEERHADCYAIVNRAKNQASAASSRSLGEKVEMGSFAKRFRDLSVSWREDERGSLALVKLRFEKDHAFGLPLEISGVTTKSWEQLP